MKVILLNGSPHKNGCVYTALEEVKKVLNKEDIEAEILWIGVEKIGGCIACYNCKKEGSLGCVFKEKSFVEFVEKAKDADGFIIGTPVYYAGPSGTLCSFLDRAFFSAGKYLKGKPAACVVNCRRGGASATFDRINKYFTINNMPIVSSQYWNSTHGTTPEEVLKDEEGLQTMRTLALNMAYLLKSIKNGGVEKPQYEDWKKTNFIK